LPPACIFCKIVAGDGPASIVLDAERVLAFMDVRQFRPGHVLVVPKQHVADIYALQDPKLGADLLSAIATVSRAVRVRLAPDGLNIWQSTGEAAGQDVFHLHFHILPRQSGDGLLRIYPSRPEKPPRDELDRLASLLRTAIGV
jgi:histidine triad (HIT) family protein